MTCAYCFTAPNNLTLQKNNSMWNCGNCQHKNSFATNTKCQLCETSKYNMKNYWNCAYCNYKNIMWYKRCNFCSKSHENPMFDLPQQNNFRFR